MKQYPSFLSFLKFLYILSGFCFLIKQDINEDSIPNFNLTYIGMFPVRVTVGRLGHTFRNLRPVKNIYTKILVVTGGRILRNTQYCTYVQIGWEFSIARLFWSFCFGVRSRKVYPVVVYTLPSTWFTANRPCCKGNQ